MRSTLIRHGFSGLDWQSLAIFHLTATIVSRARGHSAVAAAAYRFGIALRDERCARTRDYTHRGPLAHLEIMAPTGTAEWVRDRHALWNQVEATERRKDSQLARAIEVALPVELSHEENIALARDFIAQEFVSKGMIADFGICRRDPTNPHARILLTLRHATSTGFGPKARHWNRKSTLVDWRTAWADAANRHLARAGHAVRIDHRSFEAQHSELAPGRKIGIGRRRDGDETLPEHLKERVAERRRIAQENGETILEDPTVALRALAHQRSTFTEQDIIQFLMRRTDGAAQLEAALRAIMESNELVPLGAPDATPARFTSRDLLEAEKSLLKRVSTMSGRRRRGLAAGVRSAGLAEHLRTEEERRVFDHLVGEGDLKVLAAADGSKSALLAAARRAWEAQGLKVSGFASSKIGAANLQSSSGIQSRTLVERETAWTEGRDLLMLDEVCVVDGAEMIGVKQLERLLAVADKVRAKVVLVADAGQLEAMGAVSPMRMIIDRMGAQGVER